MIAMKGNFTTQKPPRSPAECLQAFFAGTAIADIPMERTLFEMLLRGYGIGLQVAIEQMREDDQEC